MARLRTRQWIREQARELADEVVPPGGDGADAFITDATANEWVNQAYAKLYDMLVASNPDWGLAETDVQTAAGEREYPLPEDFYQIRGVDLVLSTATSSPLASPRPNRVIPIESYNFLDRARYAEWPPPRDTDAVSLRYRVVRRGTDGSEATIRFEPDPGTRTFRIWYVRAAADLGDDADELDGVNGYEEYIVAEVAEKMMIKAETNEAGAVRLKQEAIARIQEMAAKRDQGRAVQVADTRTRRWGRW